MKIKIPTNCPICDSTLVKVNDQLFCRNPTCQAQSSKKVEHYAKTLNIKGLGKKTIEKLDLKDVSDIYSLLDRQEFLFSKIGEKLGNKILIEIEKTLNIDIGTFIAGMSIPLVGKTIASKLSNVVDNIFDITYDLCLKQGIGNKATENLINWITSEAQNYVDLPIKFTKNEISNSNKTVCISGKIPGYTKAKLKEQLEELGFIVKDSVTKELNYLISNESNTSKVTKAKEYNIPIISFDNFIKEFKNT